MNHRFAATNVPTFLYSIRGNLIWTTKPWRSLPMTYVCLGCRCQNAFPSSCQVIISALVASWSTAWLQQRDYTKNQLFINHPEVCWRCYRWCCCIPLDFNVHQREFTGSRPSPHSFVASTLNEIWILFRTVSLSQFDSTGWDTDSVRAIYIYWLCQSCVIRSAKPLNNNLYDVMDLFYCPVVR